MWDVLLDALIDSLKVLAIAFVLYLIISFLEEKIAHLLGKKNKVSPLIGSALGLVPQCGLSVVAADMYEKHHITMGTIIALFLACSDEALPILLSNKEKILSVLPIILVKFVFGFIIGFMVDIFYTKEKHEVDEHLEHCEHHMEEEIHHGCCNHEIEDGHESKIHKHLVHPLLHSLKIFAYVLGINIVMGLIIYFIGGEEVLSTALNDAKWFGPIISTLIGLIPNCAASVVITEVYLINGITLGACISGLCVNAGLGLLFLFKGHTPLKEKFAILAILFVSSIVLGYGTDLIMLLF